MQYETAKCPSCGASIPVQSECEQTFCLACGNRIVIKDAIQRYKVDLSGPVVVDTNIDSIYKSANGFLQLEKWEDAKRLFTKIIELDSTDYRGWWGLFLVKTQNLERENSIGMDLPLDISDAENAIRVAPEKEKEVIASVFDEYKKRCPQMHQLTIIRKSQLANCAVSIGILLFGQNDRFQLSSGGSHKCYVPIGPQEMTIYNKTNSSQIVQVPVKRVVFEMLSDGLFSLEFRPYHVIPQLNSTGIRIISEMDKPLFGELK